MGVRQLRRRPRGRLAAPRAVLAPALALLIAATASFAAPAPAAEAVPPTTVAFVRVHVVPMDGDRVLRDQAVLVEDGRIAAVGPEVRVPDGALVIDGRGSAFLSPGLADMHVHSDTREDLALYLANGVTTVLNMGGARSGFVARTRPAVNRGDLPGPHVHAAFIVDGAPDYEHFFVTTAEEARSIVRLAKTNGYEFIKVYNNLAPDTFEALADEGRRLGVPIVGHGVTKVGLERQLAAGQVLVAHAEEFLYTVFTPPGAEPADGPPDVRDIPRAVGLVRRSGAFVTADLATFGAIAEQWGRPAVVEGFMRLPEVRYLSPGDRIRWRGSGYARRQGSLGDKLSFLRTFVKAMSDAGVPLVTGTDSPTIPGLVPGHSLHRNLRELEAAGLSRFEALSAATRTPGEFIRKTVPGAEPFGTVTVGSRADLVLSNGNPLEDLSVLTVPAGVMVRGRWYDAAALGTLLDGVAQKYRSAELR